LARNVLGSGSREKTDDGGDVFWFAQSSHRDRGLRTLQKLVGKGRGHICFDEPWRDGVDPYFSLGDLFCEATCERQNSGLGGGVIALARICICIFIGTGCGETDERGIETTTNTETQSTTTTTTQTTTTTPIEVEVNKVTWSLNKAYSSLVNVIWNQNVDGYTWVEFSADKESWRQSPATLTSKGTGEVLLLGVPYACEVDFTVVVEKEGFDTRSEVHTATTGALPVTIQPVTTLIGIGTAT
jgi:hypothetical protein